MRLAARIHGVTPSLQDRLPADFDPAHGLAPDAVADQRARYGRNTILAPVSGGWKRLLQDTLRDPMLWFLLLTALVHAVLGERGEALILLLALLPLLGMDAWLHRRTQASLASLGEPLSAQVQVRRAGGEEKVQADELVPADVVLLTAGDFFPADGVLVQAEQAQVDESALTGESFPVRKRAGTLHLPAAEVGESWAHAGTRLLGGSATLVVLRTGSETRYGQIVRDAVGGVHEATPLQRAVREWVWVLLALAAVACLTLGGARLLQGHGLEDAFLSAVTLAVAALPEEFPIVLTFFLAIGVHRLARRKALVRRAVVVENIGRVTCLCTDKTGTLTEGRLVLAHTVAAGALEHAAVLALAATASRNETGDPLDLAILAGAAAPAQRVRALFPFTEDRKREVVLVETGEGLQAVMKGAPEEVFGRCTFAPAERADWVGRVHSLAADAHKVIAVARQDLDPRAPPEEPTAGYVLAGLLAFEDPVREAVPAAVRACRDAGIRVIMVTGDHPATARAVARATGIETGDVSSTILTGDELEAALARGDESGLDRVTVIARALPHHKLSLVKALQARGECVAVTGDGVNDAPALQVADVGIAMGARGTRTARESAGIVLLDDNFASLVAAIAEGRQVFGNLRRAFRYLLAIHLPFVLTAALVPMLGYPLLFLPVHIVWMELIIHPTVMLAFDSPPAANVVLQPPIRGKPRFLSPGLWVTTLLAGGLTTAAVMWSYARSLGIGWDIPHARAMALVVLVLSSTGMAIGAGRLSLRRAMLLIGLAGGSAALFIQLPWLAGLLHLAALHADDWMLALGVSALVGGVMALPASLRATSP